MITKVLIANRGEIAVRIIRACREMGLPTVAVCSTADKRALHAQIADECVCIGPPPSKDSYLNMSGILAACEQTGADAVHPGFGFLSENAYFARLCGTCGVKFIGPTPESIELLGNKARAKATMREAGVPVVPGSDGAVASLEEAKEIARKIGFPVMIKASAGGGGRGIRVARNMEEFENAFLTAGQEAMACFGDGDLYLEKFLVNPRHIEIQILADEHGGVIHLGEREAAKTAVQAAGYHNAGTIEFLVDANGGFYFMEMNTRIQVEHPVTEMVTGVDIVKQQLRIAMGRPLALRQEDVHMQGHAIECRINAENPELGFRPSPGRIDSLYMPGGPGVRIDSAVYGGYTIPPYYDSMIAKLIVHANTRQEAIMKMRWALAEFLVEGVDTNIDFQLSLLHNKDFEAGNYDIGFLDRLIK